MNINLISVDDLKVTWRNLYTRAKNDKVLDFDAFNAAFTQTFSVLSEYAGENFLDKRYIELMAEAFLFANIEGSDYDSKSIAAFVLTDRLLKHLAFKKSESANNISTVYVAKSRKEIELDFNNVSESIDKLMNILGGDN